MKDLADMCVHVYVKYKQVADKYLNWRFQNNKLEKRSQFKNLLIHYNYSDAAVFSTRKTLVIYQKMLLITLTLLDS